MQFWGGGKIGFKDGHGVLPAVDRPPSASKKRDADQRSAHSTSPTSVPLTLLNTKELSDKQVEYIRMVLHPLLESMTTAAMCDMPERPAVCLAKWLLDHLKVPASITDPVSTWLGPAAGPKRRTSQDAPRPEEGAGEAPAPAARTGGDNRGSFEARPEAQQLRSAGDAPLEGDQREDGLAPLKSPSFLGLGARSQGCLKRPTTPLENRGSVETTSKKALTIEPPKGSFNESSNCGGRRKVSMSAVKHEIVEIEEAKEANVHRGGRQRSDSFTICKQRMKRGRAVSIFIPTPQIPPQEAIALVKGVPLFKSLNQEQIETLAFAATVKTFDPDEEVVRHGQRPEEMYIIHSGEGRVSVPTVTGCLKRGECFGETAIAKSHLCSAATVTAGADGNNPESGGRMVALAISSKLFEDLGFMPVVGPKRGLVNNSNFIKRTFTRANWRAGRRGTPSDVLKSLKIVQHPSAKNEDDRQLILKAIKANTHFTDWGCLSDEQMEAMTDMFRLIQVDAGKDVITQGEHGNTFFIVHDGLLEVLVDNMASATGGSLRIGDSFGELALLYNCPRKATIRAARQCQLWVMTRNDYRNVMRLKSEAQDAEYMKLINMVQMLREKLSKNDKETLVSALEEAFFVKDEWIVTQGEEGSTFYMVFDGACEVLVDGQRKDILRRGQYFGERALLNSEPRRATVVCSSETATLLSLDSHSFSLLLGDVLDEVAEEPNGAPRQFEGAGRPGRKRASTAPNVLDTLLAGRRKNQKKLVPREDLVPIGALGYGAFGFVSLQQCKTTRKLYALKALSKGYAKREHLQEHVISERKTLMMLDSRFVVPLHCTYRDEQYVYFLMDPALGGELYEVFAENQNLFGSESHARFWGTCAIFGLEHLHSCKIVYRDLKLENMLLYENGYAVLTDLGLAKVVLGKTYTVCGTADYFAPETLRQVGHNRAVDWWALGILLFIMMAGRSPFDADNVMQIYKNIVKGFKKELFPDTFSQDLQNLIRSICRKKPEERLPMAPGGTKNLEAHIWFQELSFSKVQDRSEPSPYVPPPPDYAKLADKLKLGPPKFTEFVENDPATDEGWDDDFASRGDD